MKKSILLALIFMFFVPCFFIVGMNQPAYAVTYTKLTNGTASASSSMTPASNAFDSNGSTSWTSTMSIDWGGGGFDPPNEHWLRYTLPSARIVTKYKIALGSGMASWALQGSNNGSSWTNLHSGTQSQIGQEITISNTTAYIYYRIIGAGVFCMTETVCYDIPFYPWIMCIPLDAYAAEISELELYTSDPPDTPAAPTGPGTDADGSYTISWSTVTGATSYQLQEQYNSGTWSTIYNSTGTSIARSGRSPGSWKYRVKACNDNGCSAYSSTKTVLVAPPVPGTPSGPSTDYNGSYTISWNSVTGANRYQLQERLNSGTWSTVYDSSGTSAGRTGRTVGTWGYRVRAYGVTWSAYSGVKNVAVTVPLVPGGLSGPATDADGSYTITWNSVSEASSYLLQERYNGGTWSTIHNASGTSKSRTGNAPGTWNYRVRSASAVGSSAFSSIITVLVAPPVPGTPSGPSTDYNGSYTISWNSTTGANRYQLQERFNGGTWVTAYDNSGTSVNLTGRTNAGTWGYRVRACGVTWSAYSGTRNVTVTVSPVPGGLSGPAIDADGSYTISWNAASEASSYQLQERYNGGSWATIHNASGTSKSRTGNAPGTWDYRVRATSAVGSSAYSSIITVLVAPSVPGTPSGPSTDYNGSYTISWSAVTGANQYQLQERLDGGTWSTVYSGSSTSASRTGRTAGTWGYRVRAYGVTWSAYSGTKNVVVTIPTVPGGLSGPSTDLDGSYTISWNSVSEASSYQLQERHDGGSWTTIHSASGTSKSISNSEVGTWEYQVRATSAVGSSAYSSTITVLIVPPSVPVLSGPSSTYNGSYTISWGAVTGATSYELQEKLDSGSWTTIYSGSDTSVSRTGRTEGTWSYRARAYGVAWSDYSSVIAVVSELSAEKGITYEYDELGRIKSIIRVK